MESFLDEMDEDERERLVGLLSKLRKSLDVLYEAAEANEPLSGAELEQESSR